MDVMSCFAAAPDGAGAMMSRKAAHVFCMADPQGVTMVYEGVTGREDPFLLSSSNHAMMTSFELSHHSSDNLFTSTP